MAPKRDISFTKPPEPAFIKRMKDAIGYQEPPDVETKKSRADKTQKTKSLSPETSPITSPTPNIADRTVPDICSEYDDVLIYLKSDYPSFLIEEMYKKHQAEMDNRFTDLRNQLMRYFPKEKLDETKIKKKATIQNCLANCLVCAFIMFITTLGLCARCLIVSTPYVLEICQISSPLATIAITYAFDRLIS